MVLQEIYHFSQILILDVCLIKQIPQKREYRIMEYLSLLMLPYRCDGCKQIVTDEDYKPIYLFHLPLILLIKLIISESNFCLSKSLPFDLPTTSSKARRPLTNKLFSSLLNSILLEFYDEVVFSEKFIWAKSLLGLPNGDTLNFSLNIRDIILWITVYYNSMRERLYIKLFANCSF